MKKALGIFIIIGLFIIGGCANNPKSQVKKGELVSEIQTEKSKKIYETIGKGEPSKNASNIASERQTSYEAAKAVALNDIATYLYGVKLESGILIKDAMAQESTIKTEVATFIRGAEVVKREWDEKNSCIITMRINIKEFQKRLKELGVE